MSTKISLHSHYRFTCLRKKPFNSIGTVGIAFDGIKKLKDISKMELPLPLAQVHLSNRGVMAMRSTHYYPVQMQLSTIPRTRLFLVKCNLTPQPAKQSAYLSPADRAFIQRSLLIACILLLSKKYKFLHNIYFSDTIPLILPVMG